jgi:hypothetical protein
MRRLSLWVLALSAGLYAFAALGGAGCSSSSAPPPSVDAGDDSTADDASDATSISTCHVDASLTVFASSDASAAPCAACAAQNCLGAIAECASDCTCINLFTCLTDSGAATGALPQQISDDINACAGSAGTSLLSNPGVRGIADCLQGVCANACSAILDGGDDGGTSAAGDAGAGSDAAAPLDADTIADAGADADDGG